MNVKHTYSCDVCSYTGTGEENLEDHILENHAVPDADNLFRCDDCPFVSSSKANYGIHFKQFHGSRSKRLISTSHQNHSSEL